MKKILLFGILLSLTCLSHTFADVNFSASSAGTTINATLSGEQGSTSSFQILVQTTPLPQVAPASSPNLAIPLSVQKPNAQGTIVWTIPNNTPSTTYYVGVIEIPQAAPVLNSYPAPAVTVTTGVDVAPVSTSTDLNNSNYTLLAPFPGLSVIPSPAQCAQEEATATQNGTAQPVCDINGLLNYAMKLLIGLSGVVLVLRLMYEGYVYMVTDVPFLKASSKAGFFSALLGLLLALTSFIILNTINPKLVNESVNIQQLAIGVTPGDDGLGVPGTSSGTTGTTGGSSGTNRSGGPVTLTLSGGGTASVIPCDPNNNEMQTITVFGGHSITIQKNLVPSLQKISAEWQQMSPRYPINTVGGYNCRSIAAMTTLSYHAYGLAVDINEDTNGVGTAGDMPASFIQLWTNEGWGWGGNWNSKKDPMHFSKGKNEQGNMVGQ